jgi:beta-N-acetylhexosaminidase
VNDIERLAREVILTGLTSIPERDRLGFAGYAIFSRNGTSAAEVRAFTDALRDRCGGSAPIVAVDQEGGRVARLQEGVEAMPSMMALGAADDLELAQRAGEQVAFDLRRAGCTLDFAPSLDLALEPGNRVIGTRSLGSDPQRVAALGAAFARGLKNGGIAPCYKHFPGHGATAVDSHEALPVLDVDDATLLSRDIVPFAAVARDAVAIMSAHVVVPSLDSQRPATLSAAIATELLRTRLGFAGVLITDCLEMDALAGSHPECSLRAVEALNAGADLLLFSHHLDFAIEAAAAIASAVEEGRLSIQRLEEAHARVARLRAAAAPPVSLERFPPHPNVGREVARRAITLVRGLPEADPVASVAVAFGGDAHGLQREAPALAGLGAPLEPTADEAQAVVAALHRIARRPILLARRAHLYPLQAEAIAKIVARYSDALVVSLLEPYDVALFESARHVLAAYGDDAAALGGLADVLFGASMPTGRLPVSLAAGR